MIVSYLSEFPITFIIPSMFWPESSSASESVWFSGFKRSIYFEEKIENWTKIRTKCPKKADSIWPPSDLKLPWTDLQTDKFN